LKHVAHNPLYQGITLDQRHIELYPDSDILPGIDKWVIHDTTLDAKQVFDDETAGFSDHPALQVDQEDTEGPVMFLEKLGVSDPENVLLHGHSSTAPALQNLVEKPSDWPDLIIHQSLHPVREYDNPTFFPGMYPTLYPYGMGGFEDPT